MNLLAIFNLYKYQLFSALASQLRILCVLLLSGKEGLGCFSLLISTTSLLALPSILIQNNSFQSRILQNKSVRIDLLFLILVQISFLLVVISFVSLALIYLNESLRSVFQMPNHIIAISVILTFPFFVLQVLAEAFLTLKNDIKRYQQSFILTNAIFIATYLSIRLFLERNSLYPVILAFSLSYILSSVISLSVANAKHYHLRFFSFFTSYTVLLQQCRIILVIFNETVSLNIITVLSVLLDWVLKTALERNYGIITVGTFQMFQSIDSLLGSIIASPSYKKVLFAFSTRTANMNNVLRREIYVTFFPIILFSLILIAVRIFFHSYPHPAISSHLTILLPLTLYLLSRLPSFYLGFLGQVLIALNKLWSVIMLECVSRISFISAMIIFISLPSFNVYSIPISALLSSCFALALLQMLSKNKYVPSANLFAYSTR